MTFTVSIPPAWTSSNLLVGYIGGLASTLGLSSTPGQESSLLSSLRGNGLAENDLQVLERVLKGKGVKLHQYQAVIQDLERLGNTHLAEGAIRERLESSRHAMNAVRDQAMREIDAAGLREDFLDHVLMETLVSFTMGFRFSVSVDDVSSEFRHFVEDRGLLHLSDLARRYLKAASDVARNQVLLESLQK
jgi:hypothetical protein